MQSGHEHTLVATAEFMSVEIEVRQRKRATRVEVRLRWPRRSLSRAAAKRRGSLKTGTPWRPAEG